MDPKTESVVEGVSAVEIESVARAVLENGHARITGVPAWQELDAVHNDRRTVAILRCSGEANVDGATLDWSVIVKVVDPLVEANVAAAWNDPAIEERVYELGLLKDTGSPFRPARCFGVSQPGERRKLFWLEDLGGAPQPPWTAEEYVATARHVGEFNGMAALKPPPLPFDLPVDVHRLRREAMGRDFSDSVESFVAHRSHPVVRETLRDVPAESVRELLALCVGLHSITPGLPHGMAFGDCHARNLFPLGYETVAIDWAGLAMDPVGSDLSVLVGSAFSWGVEEAVMVDEAESQIYRSYLDGLRSSGWSGDERDVRLGFFTHLPLYLLFAVLTAEGVRSGRANDRKEWMEARRGASLAEIPGKMAPIVAMIPGYTAELRDLLR